MPEDLAPAVIPVVNSDTVPTGVIRPTLLALNSVNHTVAVRPGHDAGWLRPRRDSGPNSVTAPNVVIRPMAVTGRFGKPQIPVRAGGDAAQARRRCDACRELRHGARHRDAPDPRGAARLGEPHRAVGAGGDPERRRAGRDAGGELRDDPGRGDPADAVRARLCEPGVPSGPAATEPIPAAAVSPDENSVTAPVGVAAAAAAAATRTMTEAVRASTARCKRCIYGYPRLKQAPGPERGRFHRSRRSLLRARTDRA